MGSITLQGSVPGNSKLQTKIRLAGEIDIPEIARVGSKTSTATFGHSMPASDLNAYLKEAYNHTTLEKTLAKPLSDIFVAYQEIDPDRVIGFVQLTQGGSVEPCLEGVEAPIQLQRLYVDGKCHGKGVGGALMKHVEKLAKEKGFVTIWLGVWEENFKAQKAYERFGFKKVGEHDFVMGKCIQTDWILMKPL
jgi:ribosomal protein S18 acetylase RimI-like enzyme